MTESFTIKEGDTQPSLEAFLKDENRQPRDLTNAAGVRFHMKNVSTQDVTVDASAQIISASDGRVLYQWQSGDTDKPGRYEAEFEVTYDSGGTETFPNDGNIDVYIEEQIA